MENKAKTALVTGANSGIGFETVQQLAKLGYGSIILATRTLEKADNTAKLLRDEGYGDVFSSLAMDTSDVGSARLAADKLIEDGRPIDLLILNAGSVTAGLSKNQDGVDLTFASTLVGHHVLIMLLLEHGIVNDHANIVIAGSEAARGDVPGMGLPDFDQISREKHQGDIQETFEAFARGYTTGKYNVMKAYSIAKLYVAWWSAELAEKLPEGIRVFTVSPGSVPGTDFGRHQSFVLRRIMLPLMDSLGRVLGIGAPASAGSNRYISAVDMPDEDSGKFFASPSGKMTGQLTEQKTEYLLDETKRNSAWNTIVKLSGGIKYSGKAEREVTSTRSVA